MTMVDDQTPAPAEQADPPTPHLKGVFSLYHTPDGGIHIAYRPDPTELDEDPEDQHIQIPAMVVALAQQMQDGKMPNPLQMMKMFRNLKDD